MILEIRSFSRKEAARHGGIYQTYLPESGRIASLQVSPVRCPFAHSVRKIHFRVVTPNWLRLGQRVRIVGSFASYDGRADRRVGRKGVIWRLCSPVFADHTYVYLDPVGAERAEKIAQVELRDVAPIEDALLVPVPFPA
ncbi:hypothetical protein [uncultured Bradyrhizobium sp.]|uniref:hypothetical protein n=1 Tax=uncultured Bradyrhizobium sp. TaxID=199684 RepID=UPI002623D6B7|nr:hypothetical protein [uncultured Bradyrhizobium sp.]